ncbi:MAG: SDR family NAD(P)-dependent oxidoreductase [Anaerolineae bacterium]
MRLQDKCALVTGAGTGIGREVALELARQGADVVLSYHSSGEGAFSAVEEIQQMGHRAVAYQADLGQVEACFGLVDQAVAFLGRIDVLVNNSGITAVQDFFEVTPDDFNRLYNVNIRGQFFCAQRVACDMRARGVGGVIINMLSIHAMAGLAKHPVYDGTKGAIEAWTRELALELAPLHIRVVGVAPGAIEVPRHRRELPDYDPEGMGKLIPWGRIGQPPDVAKVCAFLASDDADFMVGSIVVVDGGTTAKMALCLECLGRDPNCG